MKANEFVKKYGLELSREIVSKQPKWASNVSVSEIVGTWEYTEKVLPSFSIVELKRLVESHDMVNLVGGLDAANRIVCDAFHGSNGDIPEGHEELSLAIQDVELCHVD